MQNSLKYSKKLDKAQRPVHKSAQTEKGLGKRERIFTSLQPEKQAAPTWELAVTGRLPAPGQSRELGYDRGAISFSARLKFLANRMLVRDTAKKSATGSARYTAMALSWKKAGRR